MVTHLVRQCRQQLFWLLPFLCIGLIALVPARPAPVFPPPETSRIVVDARGTAVAVPVPLRGVVRGSDFLEMTHAPEMVAKVGRFGSRVGFAGSLLGRIYPQILADNALWRQEGDTLESLLAEDQGYVYFGDPNLKRFGLASLEILNNPHNHDEHVAEVARAMNAAIGREAEGMERVADYRRRYAELERDLQPQTIVERPRILQMGSAARDWAFLFVFGPEYSRPEQQEERLAVANAAAEGANLGRYQDAERILAMDPDLIIQGGESRMEFLADPRWRGLRAVREHKVYQGMGDLRGGRVVSFRLDWAPLGARWLAEVAHPDRLQPRLRDLLRAHYQESYGYTLSDDEIDNLLRVDENKDAPGYGRFMKAADQGTAP